MLRLKSSINFKKATRLSLLEGTKFFSGIRAINASGFYMTRKLDVFIKPVTLTAFYTQNMAVTVVSYSKTLLSLVSDSKIE